MIQSKTLKAFLLTTTVFAGVAVSAPAYAEKGDWMVRLRLIDVVPDESADLVPIGGRGAVDSAVVPELDFTYFISDKFAAELILATTKHTVRAVGTSLGDLDVQTVKLLPPTLTFQYHPLAGEKFSPYLGAGINYTIFYDEKPAGGAVTATKLTNEFGFALQGGLDINLQENLYFNMDIKKIFLGSDLSVNNGAITSDVSLDPWVFGVGFGIKF